MKMLIVGSNGFIGCSLAAKLKNLGFQVIEMSSTDGSGIDPARIALWFSSVFMM